MVNLFVSCRYIGKSNDSHTIYDGFDGIILENVKEPFEEEELYSLKEKVETAIKNRMGFDNVAADILYFKELKRVNYGKR